MSQVRVFQCPACGGNLQYDGGPQISFPCQYCGTAVIVPEELRTQSPGATPARPEASGSLDGAVKKILSDLSSIDDTEMQELLGMELSEAVNRAMRTGPAAQAAQLAEVLRMARTAKLEAVKLFRQIYPTVNANEALLAVTILGGGTIGQAGAKPRRR